MCRKSYFTFVFLLVIFPCHSYSENFSVQFVDKDNNSLYEAYLDIDESKGEIYLQAYKRDNYLNEDSSWDTVGVVYDKYSQDINEYSFLINDGFEVNVVLSKRYILLSEFTYANFEMNVSGEHFSGEGESNVIRNSLNRNCYSYSTPAGYESGIFVSFPKEKALAVWGLARKYGWYAYDYYGRSDSVTNEFILSDGICVDEKCIVGLSVGSGLEIFAMAKLNGFDKRVCAKMWGAVAGGSPFLIAGVPLGTFVVYDDIDKEKTKQNLRTKLITKLFDHRVTLSELISLGRGYSFILTAIGPASSLGFELRAGYWYSVNLHLELDLNDYAEAGGGFLETIQISALDVIEIRAPENLEKLPDSLIRNGKNLQYMDAEFGRVSQDGKLMDRWTYRLAEKVSEITKGTLIGDYPFY
ncbi:hypothetical protein GCE9029_00065 [Grimontia celer]|uniref:Uncharacterized protein n=1 Tax=Grimontia celer TaxID=1796497 RepID=A0A128ERI6_9GAMM|nr:hypothetical protein [Grimontia celer]CZF77197.1 hypothetical protein GCE9029_00065 [Grimontia celer]